VTRGVGCFQCFPGKIGDPDRHPHILHLDSLKTGGHRLDDIKVPLLKWLSLEWQEKRGQGLPADAPKFERKVRSASGCAAGAKVRAGLRVGWLCAAMRQASSQR
jgi:hypothetical protein